MDKKPKLSSKGIYSDIMESNYSVEICEIKFFFTSWRIMDNFIMMCDDYVDDFNEKYSDRFGLSLNMDKLALLKMYSEYEVRGFRLVYEGNEYLCLNKIHMNLA